MEEGAQIKIGHERLNHAKYQSIEATFDNWRHMACLNAVKQPFIECRDENFAVQ